MKHIKGIIKGNFETTQIEFNGLNDVKANFIFTDIVVDHVEYIEYYNKAVLQGDNSYDAASLHGCQIKITEDATLEDLTIYNSIITEFSAFELLRNDDLRAAGTFQGLVYGDIDVDKNYNSAMKNDDIVNVGSFTEDENGKKKTIPTGIKSARKRSSQIDKGDSDQTLFSWIGSNNMLGCLDALIKLLVLIFLLFLVFYLMRNGCNKNDRKYCPCIEEGSEEKDNSESLDSTRLNESELIRDRKREETENIYFESKKNNRNRVLLKKEDLKDLELFISDHMISDGDIITVMVNGNTVINKMLITDKKTRVPIKVWDKNNRILIFADSPGEDQLIATPLLELKGPDYYKRIQTEIEVDKPLKVNFIAD